MLQDFQNLLTANGFYFVDSLGNIQHSCCVTSTVKVIDFDKVKDEYCKLLGIPQLKSVDALFLAKSINSLFLIEMKSFNPALTKTAAQFIIDHFSTRGMPAKIVDSLILITSMIGVFNAPRALHSALLDANQIKVKTILLVDLNAVDMVSITLATLDKYNIGIVNRIEPDTAVMNCPQFEALIASL
ncbi:MAG: hypothetical protein EOO09_13540 [Chitinophagaceae bacterium]|nr:MAG: hypothetical protein EOO09_13540 [Chitinophagaceae bacterium]